LESGGTITLLMCIERRMRVYNRKLILVLLGLNLLSRSRSQGWSPFRFREVTEEVGILQNNQDTTSGPSVADLNQDGFLDIVQSYHARFPVEVYYGSSSGRFSRVLAFPEKGDRHGTAVGDIDGNGKVDIILAIGGTIGRNPLPPREARTAANGSLYYIGTDEAGLGGRLLRGVASRLLDLDQDGDLDLFVLSRPQLNQSNRIVHAVYENLGAEPFGNGTFQLINATGIETCRANGGFLVTDFNADGLPDILLLSPGLRLFQGTVGQAFIEVTSCALPKGLRSTGPYGGAVQLDIDNDGDMDILLSGGFRVKSSLAVPAADLLLENISENILTRSCVLRFRDISSSANLRKDGIRHGVTAADFNNDGFMDVFMPEVGSGAQRLNDIIMLNLGNKSFQGFEDHGANGALVDDLTYPTGAQAFDFDGDGLVDVAVSSRFNNGTRLEGRLRLFKNTIVNTNHYLIVQVPISINGKSTMDALLTVHTPAGTFHRVVGSVGEFRTQSFVDQVHFGLGNNSIVEAITLKLTEGSTIIAGAFQANQKVAPFSESVTPTPVSSPTPTTTSSPTPMCVCFSPTSGNPTSSPAPRPIRRFASNQ